MVNTLLLIFAPTLTTQWDKGSDTAMKNHRHRSAFCHHFSGVCSVPGGVLAAVGQAARGHCPPRAHCLLERALPSQSSLSAGEGTALPELAVCWRDQPLHMTLLMWWDYYKGCSHMQLLTKVTLCSGLSRACVCVCVCVCVLSCVTLWTSACQAPLSMGFSRQEHWSGLPFLSPGEFSASPALAGEFFTTSTT